MPYEPDIKAESLELLHSLLRRKDMVESARRSFRTEYPDAPSAMIDTAVHHVVSEGIEATIDWLAAIERYLQNPTSGLDYGAVWHVVYHLYNWLQFQALIPIARDGMIERLKDAELIIKEGEPQAALEVLKQLREHFEGDVGSPGVG